jgi:hypothetical protein
MKAVLPLFFTGLLGLGAAGASAQTAPGDPAGNQTIPEKDLSRPDASRHGGAQGGSVVDDHEKNLSNKLDASGDMIKPPPGVDPQIVKLHQFRSLIRPPSFRLLGCLAVHPVPSQNSDMA